MATYKEVYNYLERGGPAPTIIINGQPMPLSHWPRCGVDHVEVAQGIMMMHTRVGVFTWNGKNVSLYSE